MALIETVRSRAKCPSRLTVKKSSFSEAQIVGILIELEAGSPATELGLRHGVHPNTIPLCKDKYAVGSALKSEPGITVDFRR